MGHRGLAVGKANSGIALEIPLWWSEGLGDAGCCERRKSREEKAGNESGRMHVWNRWMGWSEKNTQAS